MRPTAVSLLYFLVAIFALLSRKETTKVFSLVDGSPDLCLDSGRLRRPGSV